MTGVDASDDDIASNAVNCKSLAIRWPDFKTSQTFWTFDKLKINFSGMSTAVIPFK